MCGHITVEMEFDIEKVVCKEIIREGPSITSWWWAISKDPSVGHVVLRVVQSRLHGS